MAELIEEIISQSAFKQVEEMKLNLKDLQKQFEDLLKTTGKPLFTGSGGGGAAQSKQQMDELDKVKKQIIQTQDRLTAMTTAYGQALADERVKLAQLNQELKDNTRANQAAAGSLDEMQLKLKKAQEEYRKLAETVRNSDVGKKLLADIQAQNAAVTSLEQSMGKFQRNVGNYASATMSLSQVFREIPAFTYSAQTGILGLSNNLPILIDQFKAVAAQTGSTMQALKIFGSSIFSMTNLLTIGIGLFTIFSDKIFDSGKKAKAAADELDDYTKSVASETVKLEALRTAIEDTQQPMDKRLSAVRELQKTFPDYFKGLSNEAILTGQVADAYDRAARSIEMKARANVAMKEAEVIIGKLMKAEKEYADFQKSNSAGGVGPITTSQAQMQVLDMQMQAMDAKQQEIVLLKEQLAELIKINVENTKQYGDPEKPVKDEKAKGQKIIKAKKEWQSEIIALDREVYLMNEEADKQAIENTQKALEKQIKDEERSLRERQKALQKFYQWQIDAIAAVDKAEQKRLTDSVVYTADSLLKFADIYETMLDAQHAREIGQINARESAINSRYDAEEQRIKRNFTSQAQQEEELKKLAAQREAEQKKIDRDRKKAIRERAAAQKQIDIAATIANTARAVTAALAETGIPYYLKIINAFAAGAAGLAQIERIRSTPLPEFAKGTDSAPEGYAVVGEKGHELVIEPGGKSWVTPAKDTVTYLKKGSKVIPNDKLMSMVKDSAYVQLANLAMPVTPDLYGKALVDQFEALSADVRGLKAVMENKEMAVKVMGNFDHYMHVKRNIR